MASLKSPLLYLTIVCLFLLQSCSDQKTPNDYLIYRLNSDVSTLDPAFITDVNNATIAAKLYQGLVRLDEDLKVVGDIAESWKILDSGRLYRFYLKRDRTFCNNRPVTAHDVKYSFERIISPERISPNRWVFERVKSFNIIDDHTFEIRLKEPFSPFLTMLTMPAGYVVPKEQVQRWGVRFGLHPCGSGDFVLQDWLPSKEIRLRSRKLHLERGDIKGIVYRVIPEDLTAIAEFELGNLDLIGIPGSAYSRFKKDPKWRQLIQETPSLNTYYLGMNTERPPFNELRLREAVAYAIDREKILKTFMEGRGRLADGIVPDILKNWKTTVAIEFDPNRSRRLLEELGIKHVRATMLVTAEQDVVDLAEIIQDYLKQVGIHITIRQMEWSAFKEAINKGEADLFWLSWWADYPEAENFLYPLFYSKNKGYGGNRTRYTNPMVDALLQKARGSVNKTYSAKILSEVEALVLYDKPLIPFWHRTDYTVRQAWIEGTKPYPLYTMDRAEGIKKTKAP